MSTADRWHVAVKPATSGCRTDKEYAWIWIQGNRRTIVDTEAIDVFPLSDADRNLIELAPELLAVCMSIGNVRDDGRCRSCNCEIEPEHFYCGCKWTEDELEHNVISARAVVAKTKEGC